MKKVSEKASKKAKAKSKAKAFKPVEFGKGLDGGIQEAKFRIKCEDSPKFVAECLIENQNWRRGKGRYEFNEDPKKNAPMPFCPRALGIIEDAAIQFLMNYHATVKNGKIVDFKGTIHG